MRVSIHARAHMPCFRSNTMMNEAELAADLARGRGTGLRALNVVVCKKRTSAELAALTSAQAHNVECFKSV